MSKPLRTGVVAIAAVALGLGLAGCGSDTKEEATETSTSAAASTSNEAPAPEPGTHKTIAEYIKENGITETPVKRGDPGAPTIDLPFPPGWVDAGARTAPIAYGAIINEDPAFAADPPTIVALLSKLSGNVDPAKILEYASGEIQNLPGYEGPSEGNPSELSGFDATVIGGTYIKGGVRRAIAQKTVVIPGQDGLYVLQLNADGLEDQLPALLEATTIIDEQAKITP